MDESGEFQDWEVLPNSDVRDVSGPDLVENSRVLGDVAEGDSEGMIRADYFASDSTMRHSKVVAGAGKDGSSDSRGPNWVDPCLSPGYVEISEIFGSSGEEKSDLSPDSIGFAANFVVNEGNNEKNVPGSNNSEEESNFRSDFGGFAGSSVEVKGNSEMGRGEFDEKEGGGSDSSASLEEEVDGGLNSGGVVVAEGEEEGLISGEVAAVDVLAGTESSEGESRKAVWWKLPLELLKFCVFRVSPVLSFSIAAAVMGFVILGRRLYKLRRKSLSFPLKVNVEDKTPLQLPVKKGKCEFHPYGGEFHLMRKPGLRGRTDIGGDEECYSSKLHRPLVELRVADSHCA